MLLGSVVTVALGHLRGATMEADEMRGGGPLAQGNRGRPGRVARCAPTEKPVEGIPCMSDLLDPLLK